MSFVKASMEQVSQAAGQRFPRHSRRYRLKGNPYVGPSAVKKVPARDAGFHLWSFTCACIPPSERMRSFHEQLVYRNRQGEPVVVYVSVGLGKAFSLQLRGRVFGLPHQAAMYRRRRCLEIRHLERVRVDQGNLFVVGDIGVGLIDVPDDVASSVQPVQGGGEALCHPA